MVTTRTPDEIKKGLECVADEDGGCSTCPYRYEEECKVEAAKDALALIQQLQAENAEKDRKIQQLEAERDAAVADLSQCTASHCPYCKHWDRPESAIVCINCRNGTPRCKQHFEWRGVQKEDSNA